jgi:hypothetical protein
VPVKTNTTTTNTTIVNTTISTIATVVSNVTTPVSSSSLNNSTLAVQFTHVWFPQMQCWTGLHILHATFAIIASIIFVFICLVVALCYYDSHSVSTNPDAK